MELFRKIIKRFFAVAGIDVYRFGKDVYSADGLRSVHNHDFIADPKFIKAYERGILAAGRDYDWRWRVHVGLWVAFSASKLAGDFVECGVNKGFLSSAIMDFLDWNSLNKKFYLMDTFNGIDPRYVSDEEKLTNDFVHDSTNFYVRNFESVKKNFSEWKNVHFVVGPIPDTLVKVTGDKFAYLHIDMNCVPPEVAAFNFFWDKMTPGGFILLDDYAYKSRELQKIAMDKVAYEKGVQILALPTGQGLIIKPALL